MIATEIDEFIKEFNNNEIKIIDLLSVKNENIYLLIFFLQRNIAIMYELYYHKQITKNDFNNYIGRRFYDISGNTSNKI
jgi:hypothetical protein